MHLNGKFSSEAELRDTLDFIYDKSKLGYAFHGIWEVAFNEITITTAIHNIKSNSGAKTSGVDGFKIDKYLSMKREELISLIQTSAGNYKPRPVRRVYIAKSNGKERPLGIPTLIDRIIQECIRIVIDPIAEAKFYRHSFGFRPYRGGKHAIRQIIALISNPRAKETPCIAIEGDIKGYFDNINHRILLNKVWKIGVRDKRILSILKEMLKAGYIESNKHFHTNAGTPQGGIISPLLANIYLNDFDWQVGREYLIPEGPQNEDWKRKVLRNKGYKPLYLVRYADDWIILTTHVTYAEQYLNKLKKEFKKTYKLELSEEKTLITDLRLKPIKFLGFCIEVGMARKTPNKPTDRQIVRVYPDSDRVKRQTRKICEEVKAIKMSPDEVSKAYKIEKINSMIIGLTEYWKISVCSKAYRYLDNNVNECAYHTFKKMYGKNYRKHKIPLRELTNKIHRHAKIDTKTYAVKYEGHYVGITKAFLTPVEYVKSIFDQKITPYSTDGRELYLKHNKRAKRHPLDRPCIEDEVDNKSNGAIPSNSFEYFMNREYSFNRDKGKCRCCGEILNKSSWHCHRLREDIPSDKINKVPNLIWLCTTCDEYVHGKVIDDIVPDKAKNKIRNYRVKLKTRDSSCKV